MATDDGHLLDLDQFKDLDDALAQLKDSRAYEEVLREALDPSAQFGLLTLFAMSACTRFRGLHEAVVRELEATNPHAVFPLNRAFAETVLTVAYAHDHPDYVERILERRGEQPKELKRLPIRKLIDHIAPDAPGFSQVYDELCEITHFGSVALWQPHSITGERTLRWESAPRWSNDREALVACAQLKEMSAAAVAYLHYFTQRHLTT